MGLEGHSGRMHLPGLLPREIPWHADVRGVQEEAGGDSRLSQERICDLVIRTVAVIEREHHVAARGVAGPLPEVIERNRTVSALPDVKQLTSKFVCRYPILALARVSRGS